MKLLLESAEPFVSHQAGIRNSKRGRTYTTARYKAYVTSLRDQIATHAHTWQLVARGEPVWLTMAFLYPERKRPRMQADYELRCTKPDADNIAKSVVDAMEGIVFEDDSSVHWRGLTRVHVRGATTHRIEIEVDR